MFETPRFLENKREDGSPPWIVGELLPVVPVLSESPHGHLIGPGETEEPSWEKLRKKHMLRASLHHTFQKWMFFF